MKYIRNLFATALSVVLVSWTSGAVAQQPQAQPTPLIREAIASAEGMEMTATRLEVPPGYKANSHSHPGETFVYVVSGRILNQIDDEEPKVYEAGDHFFERANALHAQFVNEDPENSAVVIIVGIRPKGQ